jgi:hypothetical protein
VAKSTRPMSSVPAILRQRDVVISVHPALAAILEATASDHFTFLTTTADKPSSATGSGAIGEIFKVITAALDGSYPLTERKWIDLVRVSPRDLIFQPRWPKEQQHRDVEITGAPAQANPKAGS